MIEGIWWRQSLYTSRPWGLKPLNWLHKVSLKNKWKKKKSITGPGKPQTCSHPIYARTLMGVCQAVRMLFSCYFQVFLSIGTLVSNLLPLSTRIGTQHACSGVIWKTECRKAYVLVNGYVNRWIIRASGYYNSFTWQLFCLSKILTCNHFKINWCYFTSS